MGQKVCTQMCNVIHWDVHFGNSQVGFEWGIQQGKRPATQTIPGKTRGITWFLPFHTKALVEAVARFGFCFGFFFLFLQVCGEKGKNILGTACWNVSRFGIPPLFRLLQGTQQLQDMYIGSFRAVNLEKRSLYFYLRLNSIPLQSQR